ncbi:MAG TPA: DUF924 family protein [Thermoanaerobaculia bacterium]|nr:DUF924 family protein [Thermoanaerobaculia bacterium]
MTLEDPQHPAPTPEAVLDFWFGESVADPSAAAARSSVWYGASPDIDRQIAGRFGGWVEAAAAGELDVWQATARGRLALVILLDQFPRNLHRGSGAAFDHDPRALELAREGAANGHLDELQPIEQVFLLMPYQHTEDLALQREGVAHYERIARAASPSWRAQLENALDFARRHLTIVERFGRFPHRNGALGREATPAERRYLEEGGERFGQ